MHAVVEILAAAFAKINAGLPAAPGGPARRFFKGVERGEGEGGVAGLIIISLGTVEPSDIDVSLNEEIQQVVIDFGYSAPVPDADVTGYGPMLAIDEAVMALVCDGTNLDSVAYDVLPGTIEGIDDANPDIGEIVRHVVVQYHARRTNPATRIIA